jgi:hypothetical protein
MSGSRGAGDSMIFDTDVLVWFLRGDSAAVRLIESQSERAISVVTAMELLQGARSRGEIKEIHLIHPAEPHSAYSGQRVHQPRGAQPNRGVRARTRAASRGRADCRHSTGSGPAVRDWQCAPFPGNCPAGGESVPARSGVGPAQEACALSLLVLTRINCHATSSEVVNILVTVLYPRQITWNAVPKHGHVFSGRNPRGNLHMRFLPYGPFPISRKTKTTISRDVIREFWAGIDSLHAGLLKPAAVMFS